MSARLRIDRAGPLTTIQDRGRLGMLAHGISASGPMDRSAWNEAVGMAGSPDGVAIEFTRAGLDLTVVSGAVRLAWSGGHFNLMRNGIVADWRGAVDCQSGDRISITPGPTGNYGYLAVGSGVALAPVLGSRSTSTRVGLGGLEGRALRQGDVLDFAGEGLSPREPAPREGHEDDAPLRFIWGLHAELFDSEVRHRFLAARFSITAAMDRMGVRLGDAGGVFAGQQSLSLVSAPIVAGDIQILGDGTPIVLMRDHQPTGGYPRIGTVIGADLDRFAQMRPETLVAFTPVTVDHAHALRRGQAQ